MVEKEGRPYNRHYFHFCDPRFFRLSFLINGVLIHGPGGGGGANRLLKEIAIMNDLICHNTTKLLRIVTASIIELLSSVIFYTFEIKCKMVSISSNI